MVTFKLKMRYDCLHNPELANQILSLRWYVIFYNTVVLIGWAEVTLFLFSIRFIWNVSKCRYDWFQQYCSETTKVLSKLGCTYTKYTKYMAFVLIKSLTFKIVIMALVYPRFSLASQYYIWKALEDPTLKLKVLSIKCRIHEAV